MDGIAAQQRGALFEIVALALADDDGAQAHFVAVAGTLDQQTRQQPTDAPEPVQNDIARRLFELLLGPPDDAGQFRTQKVLGRYAFALRAIYSSGGPGRCAPGELYGIPWLRPT